MTLADPLDFDTPSLRQALALSSEAAIDDLPFGVIGFDAAERIRVYSRSESRFSGLAPGRVLGHGLFTVVARCLDNELVAGRFRAAQAQAAVLDATVDYVLTWHMVPTPVRLRLLSAPGEPSRFLAVRHRRTEPGGA